MGASLLALAKSLYYIQAVCLPWKATKGVGGAVLPGFPSSLKHRVWQKQASENVSRHLNGKRDIFVEKDRFKAF